MRVASRRPGPDGTRFDWADPATHAPALDGVDRVYLVAPAGVVEPGPLVAPFLAAARYRRWPAKLDMVVAVLSEFSVPLAEVADTGSLRGDLAATLRAVRDWLTHPRFAAILPDLTAEAGRNPVLAEAVRATIGEPRRALGAVTLHRAVERGELPADLDLELALDLVAAPLFWRLSVRRAEVEPDYLDRLAEHLLRALGARQPGGGTAK